MKIRSFTMLLTMLAGWINRHQQDIIEYLKTENTILRSKIAKERIILNDQQRKLLAVLGKKLGRKALSQVCCAFSSDTILKWHRKLIAMKYDGSKNRKPGKPRISEQLEKLIIKIAKYNRGWGYRRIAGQLKYLGYKVSHYTPTHCQDKNLGFLRWTHHHVLEQLERREPEGRPECQLLRRTPRLGCGSPKPGVIADYYKVQNTG